MQLLHHKCLSFLGVHRACCGLRKHRVGTAGQVGSGLGALGVYRCLVFIFYIHCVHICVCIYQTSYITLMNIHTHISPPHTHTHTFLSIKGHLSSASFFLLISAPHRPSGLSWQSPPSACSGIVWDTLSWKDHLGPPSQGIFSCCWNVGREQASC